MTWKETQYMTGNEIHYKIYGKFSTLRGSNAVKGKKI
jgi:hypothetical protein